MKTAMNTIPTTSREHQIPYTVVGGKKQDKIQRYPHTFSLLILNRRARIFKQEMFGEFEKLGFEEIISLEDASSSYDLEHLTRKFPKVRFLQFGADTAGRPPLTMGMKINIGFEEARGRFICVIWNDIRFHGGVIPPSVFDEVRSKPILCRVPHLFDIKGEEIPSLMGPAFFKSSLKIVPIEMKKSATPSIYPFDYCGFYDKEKFLLSGGFDGEISKPYWQVLDFGFRNYMWGEEILSLPTFRLDYSHDIPSFDTSVEESYKTFYLKNLAVRFNGDSGVLSKWKFFSFYMNSGLSLFQAIKEFRQVREWVHLNRYRFVQDAVSVTDLWRLE